MSLIFDASPKTLAELARLLDCANQNAALLIEALCCQSAVLADGMRQSQVNTGQVEVAAQIRALVGRSQVARLAPPQVPCYVVDRSAPFALGAELPGHPGGRNAFADSPPPDRYSVHCTPQIHGAFLEQLRHARQVLAEVPVSASDGAVAIEACVRAPLMAAPISRCASGQARIKAAIAAMSSISERRLAKLLDPSQNHGLPASLVPNPDANHYGLMVLRYRAAVLVSELSDLATPASTHAPVAAGVTDRDASVDGGGLSGAGRMCEALQTVLALERYAVVQALRVRKGMLALVYGQSAPKLGDFAEQVIDQFDRAGLPAIWNGSRQRHEIGVVRRMLLAESA